MCLAIAGRRRSKSISTVCMSGWCARLKARLRPTVVLPQPAVGEVMPSEVQPLSRIIRSVLVRIMSKVACTGSRRSKVTIRFVRITAGSGVKASSSAQTGPAGRGAGQRSPAGRRGAGAAPLSRCSLAFWIAAWIRSITVLFYRGTPRTGPGRQLAPSPTAPSGAPDQEVERQIIGMDREERDRDADDDQRQHHQHQRALDPQLALRPHVGDGDERLDAEPGAELGRPADAAVQKLEQQDEAEAGADPARHAGAGDQQAVRLVRRGSARPPARSARSARPWTSPRAARRPRRWPAARWRRCTAPGCWRSRAAARRAPARWPASPGSRRRACSSSASIRAFSSALNSSRPSISASAASYSDMPGSSPSAARCSATTASRPAMRVSSSRRFGLVAE